ncbi:hypothetical protein B0J13DRAFT_562733 [Dactylonectria estremocensis]|uniref:Serine protease n=1 Tax=Dactylonectria estremocensis TaxID=1079267 RepID=A0A9P9IUN6_9HYPO|nr:hypothetical protein B0J13DRAFT_562733 [Dactylonectria estremocensis]
MPRGSRHTAGYSAPSGGRAPIFTSSDCSASEDDDSPSRSMKSFIVPDSHEVPPWGHQSLEGVAPEISVGTQPLLDDIYDRAADEGRVKRKAEPRSIDMPHVKRVLHYGGGCPPGSHREMDDLQPMLPQVRDTVAQMKDCLLYRQTFLGSLEKGTSHSRDHVDNGRLLYSPVTSGQDRAEPTHQAELSVGSDSARSVPSTHQASVHPSPIPFELRVGLFGFQPSSRMAADWELESTGGGSASNVTADRLEAETIFSQDDGSVAMRPTDSGPPSSNGCGRKGKEKIIVDEFHNEADLLNRLDDPCHAKLPQDLAGIWTGEGSATGEDLSSGREVTIRVIDDSTDPTGDQPRHDVITPRLNFAPLNAPAGDVPACSEDTIDRFNDSFRHEAAELNPSALRETPISGIASGSEDDQMRELEFMKAVCQLDVLPSEPMLAARFRQYDVLLDVYRPAPVPIQQENPEKILKELYGEGYDEIQSLFLEMDETIHSIALTTSAAIHWSTQVEIKWKAFPKHPDLFSRMQHYVADPLIRKDWEGLSVTSSRVKKLHRKQLLETLAAPLAKLERLFKERAGGDWAVTSDITGSPLMVGWPLREQHSSSAVDARSRNSLPDDNEETTFGIHEREEVPKEDLKPNGKSRGITKLLLEFEESPGKTSSHIGSGWLVDKDTIATVGHCVYDKNYGRLVAVHVVAGYETDSREVRTGTHAVVHWDWYKSFSSSHDLAFIRLNQPFENTRQIPYLDTPSRGIDMPISAYGYPSDLSCGERMHYSKCKVSYNLTETAGMLEYDLDTAGGTSGGPVCDRDGKVIGVHRGWGWAKGRHRRSKKINKAVIIDQGANNVGAFLHVLKYMATGGREAGPRVVLRAMNAAKDFHQYTVQE